MKNIGGPAWGPKNNSWRVLGSGKVFEPIKSGKIGLDVLPGSKHVGLGACARAQEGAEMHAQHLCWASTQHLVCWATCQPSVGHTPSTQGAEMHSQRLTCWVCTNPSMGSGFIALAQAQ